MNVSTVHSVSVNGSETSDYAWRSSGLIRLGQYPGDDWGRLINADYDAGVDANAIAAVANVFMIFPFCLCFSVVTVSFPPPHPANRS
jgi:hypothetical protein